MKGLLYKDFKMLWNTRILVIYVPLVLFLSLVSVENFFLKMYPVLFAGVLPMSLQSYDEKSHFELYVQALPVTRASLVHSKYIVGVILVCGFAFLSAIVQAVFLMTQQLFSFSEILSATMFLIAFGCMVTAIIMPIIFKFGVEKGRLVYMAALIVIAVFTGLFSGMVGFDMSFFETVNGVTAVSVVLVTVVLYWLSLCLSVRFYSSREF